MPGAHLGPGVVVVAAVISGVPAGPVLGACVAGAFAALYAAAPAVLLRRTKTGWRDAARRAYLLTFGWGDLAVSAVLS